MNRRILVLLAALAWLLGALPATAQVTVPYPTFVVDTVADPDQVNANFAALSNNALNRAGGTLTGNMTVSGGVTIDGIDLSSVLGATGVTPSFTTLAVSGAATVGSVSSSGTIAGTAISGTTVTGTGAFSSASTITGTVHFASGLGSNAAPVFSFTGDPNTGVFSTGADALAVTAGGTTRGVFDSTGLTVTGQVLVSSSFGGAQFYANNDGTVSAPVFSRSTDANTGVYFPAAEQIAFTTDGAQRLLLTSAGLFNALGSTSAPTYSFSGDANTGIYSGGADQVQVTTGGVTRIAVTSALAFTGNVTITGDNTLTGQYYPGRIDSPGTAQGTIYLASHNSYGLYTASGMYITGMTHVGATVETTSTTLTASTGNNNDNFVNNVAIYYVNGEAGGVNLTGFAGGTLAAGRLLSVCNVGTTQTITVVPDSGLSTAANRVVTTGGTIAAGTCMRLQYDGTVSRWRVIQ